MAAIDLAPYFACHVGRDAETLTNIKKTLEILDDLEFARGCHYRENLHFDPRRRKMHVNLVKLVSEAVARGQPCSALRCHVIAEMHHYIAMARLSGALERRACSCNVCETIWLEQRRRRAAEEPEDNRNELDAAAEGAPVEEEAVENSTDLAAESPAGSGETPAREARGGWRRTDLSVVTSVVGDGYGWDDVKPSKSSSL